MTESVICQRRVGGGVGSVPFSKWSQVRAEALSRLVRMGCAVKCADARIQVEDRVAQYFHVG